MLTDELKTRLGNTKASFVNIDCDIYTATVVVLDWIEDLLHDGSIIYFDDINLYNYHPRKAQLRAIDEFNRKRTGSGLALASELDVARRVYMYWRDQDVQSEALQL